jgi:hypothetical protein
LFVWHDSEEPKLLLLALAPVLPNNDLPKLLHHRTP